MSGIAWYALLGLVLGNFTAAIFGLTEPITAFDRTFFQVGAVLWVMFVHRQWGTP